MNSIIVNRTSRPWNPEHERILINFYRQHEVLWNPEQKEYFIRSCRHEAYVALLELLGFRYSIYEVKQKFKNLQTVYRRELKKVQSDPHSPGTGIYYGQWTHFQALDFLSRVSITPRNQGKTANSANKTTDITADCDDSPSTTATISMVASSGNSALTANSGLHSGISEMEIRVKEQYDTESSNSIDEVLLLSESKLPSQQPLDIEHSLQEEGTEEGWTQSRCQTTVKRRRVSPFRMETEAANVSVFPLMTSSETTCTEEGKAGASLSDDHLNGNHFYYNSNNTNSASRLVIPALSDTAGVVAGNIDDEDELFGRQVTLQFRQMRCSRTKARLRLQIHTLLYRGLYGRNSGGQVSRFSRRRIL